jgi:hypothetical protein
MLKKVAWGVVGVIGLGTLAYFYESWNKRSKKKYNELNVKLKQIIKSKKEERKLEEQDLSYIIAMKLWMNNPHSMYTAVQGRNKKFSGTESHQTNEEVKRNETVYGQGVVESSDKLPQTFFEIVKKGDLAEIQSFLSNLPLNSLVHNNMDASKLVDNNYRHTGLFYATLIKNSQK